jgi:hypothetical protein
MLLPQGYLEKVEAMEFRVKVVPKSSKTELVGYLPDGTWKVKVAARQSEPRALRVPGRKARRSQEQSSHSLRRNLAT